MDPTAELHKAYRPKTLKAVIGQPEAVRILQGYIRKKAIPQAILFTGPSGVGKTTLARILQSKLQCGDMDFKEVNAADTSGIELPRSIKKEYNRMPMEKVSKCRIYLIDEAHGLTTPAQNAFLKMLEDPPANVYFIFATTDPGKLLPTVKTRCAEIPLKPVTPTDLKKLVYEVAGKANIAVTVEVLDALINAAGGSARQCLVDLGKIAAVDGEQERLDALAPAAVTATAMFIVNTLIPFKGRPNWSDAANAINYCEEDLEKVRQTVLSCAARQIVQGGKWAHRAYLVIVAFEQPFFHSRKAGMLAAAWQVFCTKD